MPNSRNALDDLVHMNGFSHSDVKSSLVYVQDSRQKRESQQTLQYYDSMMNSKVALQQSQIITNNQELDPLLLSILPSLNTIKPTASKAPHTTTQTHSLEIGQLPSQFTTSRNPENPTIIQKLILRKQQQSLTPMKYIADQSRTSCHKSGSNTARASNIQELISSHQMVNRPVKFVDFALRHPGKYYELGGLGPSNIGTTEWLKAKEKQSSISDYVNSMNVNNYNPSTSDIIIEQPSMRNQIRRQ